MTVLVTRQQALGLVELTRGTSCLYAGAYTLVGAWLAQGIDGLRMPQAWLAALIVVLVAAYGFAINDYLDREVDRIEKPNRPLPAGRITPSIALGFSAVVALVAWLLSWSLGAPAALFTAATIALTGLYSLRLKNTVLIGNAAMATLIASISLFGAFVLGPIPLVVWIIAGLMWLFDCSHEVLKTTADHAGDRQAGLQTIATAWGVRGAVLVCIGFLVSFLGVALLPWGLGLAGWPYLLCLAIGGLLPSLLVIGRLLRDQTMLTITFTLKVMRWMWITNLLPILALGQ